MNQSKEEWPLTDQASRVQVKTRGLHILFLQGTNPQTEVKGQIRATVHTTTSGRGAVERDTARQKSWHLVTRREHLEARHGTSVLDGLHVVPQRATSRRSQKWATHGTNCLAVPRGVSRCSDVGGDVSRPPSRGVMTSWRRDKFSNFLENLARCHDLGAAWLDVYRPLSRTGRRTAMTCLDPTSGHGAPTSWHQKS